jgi:hypothetical protein
MNWPLNSTGGNVMPRTFADILNDITREALISGDQTILDLVEEIVDLLGFDKKEEK